MVLYRPVETAHVFREPHVLLDPLVRSKLESAVKTFRFFLYPARRLVVASRTTPVPDYEQVHKEANWTQNTDD